MANLTLPIHGLIYLQDVTRLGSTSAQTAPVDGFLTEHNRQEASISTEIIGNKDRTVDGTLRSYTVANKKTISLSWTSVPADYAHTVDGQLVPTSNVIYGMGGYDMLKFYESYYATDIYVYIINRSATRTSGLTQAHINTDLAAAASADSGSANNGDRYLMRFSNFSWSISKRNVKTSSTLSPTDLWNVDLSIEEV